MLAVILSLPESRSLFVPPAGRNWGAENAHTAIGLSAGWPYVGENAFAAI